jgi:hypothetical protein
MAVPLAATDIWLSQRELHGMWMRNDPSDHFRHGHAIHRISNQLVPVVVDEKHDNKTGLHQSCFVVNQLAKGKGLKPQQ